MHPIGWDAFGLPAENAAIKRDADPRAWTYENIAVQKASMRRFACSFDWDRVFNTCDPEYYKWSQWIFLKLFEAGLAYESDKPINFCPSCKTGLANDNLLHAQYSPAQLQLQDEFLQCCHSISPGSERAVEVILHAQCSAEGFYRRLGFKAHGDIFDDAGIDHIEMTLQLA